MVLNYGHTLGHALERLEGYAGRTHGEAIAVGMAFAARLGERIGVTADGLGARTDRLLRSLGLEPEGPLPPVDRIWRAFQLDKKFHGRVRFVLLEDVGMPVVVDDVHEADIRGTLEAMGAGS
jgi:3-dehydroquinate synthase